MGRIDIATVDSELARLQRLWSGSAERNDGLEAVLDPAQLAELDPFDRVQLAYVWQVCEESASLSEAGRRLFAASRERRASTNDADRLRKYLARFGLDFGARR
jgi:transcriptional regulatory protein RtcR